MNRIIMLLKISPFLAVIGYYVFTKIPWGTPIPEYNAISLMAQNYMPYNLSGFTITDDYGNRVSGKGDNPPGDGGGSLECCYRLKGTEFIIKWDYYDADQWLRAHYYDGKPHGDDTPTFHAETHVSMPQSPVPKRIGYRILEVHFYPDHHVEFQFPGGLLDASRIPMTDVVQWMRRNYRDQMDKRYHERDDQHFRRETRIIASAWLKYRLVDLNDLEQYTYFNLLINDRFDAHPDVQRILQSTKDTPGAFAQAIQALPETVMSELKTDHFPPVDVPPIAEGLLPPPPTDEKPHD